MVSPDINQPSFIDPETGESRERAPEEVLVIGRAGVERVAYVDSVQPDTSAREVLEYSRRTILARTGYSTKDHGRHSVTPEGLTFSA